MARCNTKSASVHPRSDVLDRLLASENMYAATLLIDHIDPARVPVRIKPLLEKAHWEIQNGDVSEQTLDMLITMQPAH